MTPSKQIDQYLSSITDWRGQMLLKIREIVSTVEPKLTEEWKWGCPVWTSNGLVCSMNAFKDHVGMHFFKGASLSDPHKLFNGGAEAKVTRSIKFLKADQIPETDLKALIEEAVQFNNSKK